MFKPVKHPLITHQRNMLKPVKHSLVIHQRNMLKPVKDLLITHRGKMLKPVKHPHVRPQTTLKLTCQLLNTHSLIRISQ